MLRVRIIALFLSFFFLSLSVGAQNATNAGAVAAPAAAVPAPAAPATAPTPVATPPASVVTPAPGTTAVQTNPPQTVVQSNGQQTTLQQVLCPNPSQLVKNGFYWGTPTGGWKSYSESFDTSVVSFIGAQWVGVNVGKMICIYKGNIALSFPITVQNDILVQAPTGGSWGQDLGGYRNCHSNNLADCPFVVQTQGINMQQVYEGLNFYKGQQAPAQTGGSSLPPAPFFPQ